MTDAPTITVVPLYSRAKQSYMQKQTNKKKTRNPGTLTFSLVFYDNTKFIIIQSFETAATSNTKHWPECAWDISVKNLSDRRGGMQNIILSPEVYRQNEVASDRRVKTIIHVFLISKEDDNALYANPNYLFDKLQGVQNETTF